MRFTILMRVSLSLICSGGRNGGSDSDAGGGPAPTPRGGASRGAPAPRFPAVRPCGLRLGTSTEAALQERPWLTAPGGPGPGTLPQGAAGRWASLASLTLQRPPTGQLQRPVSPHLNQREQN